MYNVLANMWWASNGPVPAADVRYCRYQPLLIRCWPDIGMLTGQSLRIQSLKKVGRYLFLGFLMLKKVLFNYWWTKYIYILFWWKCENAIDMQAYMYCSKSKSRMKWCNPCKCLMFHNIQQGNQRWQTSPAAPPGIYRNFIWGVRTSTPVDLGNYNA